MVFLLQLAAQAVMPLALPWPDPNKEATSAETVGIVCSVSLLSSPRSRRALASLTPSEAASAARRAPGGTVSAFKRKTNPESSPVVS